MRITTTPDITEYAGSVQDSEEVPEYLSLFLMGSQEAPANALQLNRVEF